jgi:hypothetical protein
MVCRGHTIAAPTESALGHGHLSVNTNKRFDQPGVAGGARSVNACKGIHRSGARNTLDGIAHLPELGWRSIV